MYWSYVNKAGGASRVNGFDQPRAAHVERAACNRGLTGKAGQNRFVEARLLAVEFSARKQARNVIWRELQCHVKTLGRRIRGRGIECENIGAEEPAHPARFLRACVR